MFETLFYQPILNLVIFLYNIIPGHDLGLTIIALTIVIKAFLWPLSSKALRSQKELQEMQPKIEELKEKYKDRKDLMAQEMMKLYRDNKVNPFSSCLPLLIQMPFLIAVFRVFQNGFENGSLDLVYGFINRPDSVNYMFLGMVDLGQRNVVLAVFAGLAQFWQTKMIMAKRPEIKTKESQDEDMAAIMNKQMMYMMPIMTIIFGLSFPGGLTLYWLTTTLLTVAQQFYMFNKGNDKKDKEMIEGEIVKK